jgi:hypothetical protein
MLCVVGRTPFEHTNILNQDVKSSILAENRAPYAVRLEPYYTNQLINEFLLMFLLLFDRIQLTVQLHSSV